ncbi:TetR/AcrR family transcriptional regulator [Hymenobacter terrenus]|uniref:TetR/AcrR family transcriptional regulator n=1 Tax=Hymenobacter terrenus TaxID=1629124 RepID=UPI000619F57F|nr:TetR/AcrR family transcriptional regulator [Hymenobacter terrenus]
MSKAARTKQLIIEKAAPLFNTKGVAGTSMSDILTVTKLAKGSLYVHFENKENLVHEVVDYQLGRLSEVVRTTMGRQKTAKAQLFAYIDLHLDPMQPPLLGGCPLLNFGTEADDTNEVVRKKVNAVVEGAQQNFRRIIEAGIANDEFKPDWNASEFATKLFAMVEGGILMTRVAQNNQAMKLIAGVLKKEIEENAA